MTSPEIAISSEFNDEVLRHESFYSRICMLAIDELHLVDEWKDFRNVYSNIGVVRTRLPRSIPCVGVSATLDDETLEQVRKDCGFTGSTRTIKTPLDRSEIYMQYSQLKQPQTGMKDLQHILPAVVENYLSIPKIVIYVDNLSLINELCQHIQGWMRELNYPREALEWVKPLSAPMADWDKQRIQAEFKKLADTTRIRILVCTDAYGMGVDNPDIQRVYQWLVPSSMAKVMQRMGRALRSGKGQAHFILLYPSWCIGVRSGRAIEGSIKPKDAEDITPEANSEIEIVDPFENEHKKIVKKSAPDRRRDLPRGIWDLINAGAKGRCHRKTALEFYHDVELDDQTPSTFEKNKPNPCCSSCHPEASISIDVHDSLNLKAQRNAPKRAWYTSRLEMWREKKAKEVFSDTWCQYIPTLIMPDEILRILSSFGDRIQDMTTLKRITQNAWSGVDSYGNQILALLELGQKLRIDDYEVQEERIKKKSALDAKKKKPTSTGNVELDQFNERRQKWVINQRLKPLSKGEGTEGKKPSNIRTESGKPGTEHASSVPGTPKRGSYLKAGLDTRERRTPERRKGARTPATPRRQALEETTANQMILQPSSSREHRRRPANLIGYDVQPQVKRSRPNITPSSRRVRPE